MRIIISVILFSFFVSCSVNNVLNNEVISKVDLEAGRCYFSVLMESKNDLQSKEVEFLQEDNPFIIQLDSPQFEKVEKTYSFDEFENRFNKNGNLQHQTRPVSTKFRMTESDLSDFTILEDPKGYMFCLVEIAPLYKTISIRDFKNDSITITEELTVQESRLTKYSVRKKPKDLKSNQFYFDQGYWTIIEEAIAGHASNYLIKNIQIQLNMRGYSLTENNKFDNQTKAALIDFQKKNNLEQGSINVGTLKKLGLRQ